MGHTECGAGSVSSTLQHTPSLNTGLSLGDSDQQKVSFSGMETFPCAFNALDQSHFPPVEKLPDCLLQGTAETKTEHAPRRLEPHQGW